MTDRRLHISGKKFAIAAAVASVTLGLLQPASAAIKTWDGGGADGNWSASPANWDNDTAPAPTDALVFDGSTQLVTTNDYAANTQFNGVTFASTAGAFTLGGNAVNLAGDVIDNSTAAQLVTLNTVLQQNTNVTVAAGGTVTFGTTAVANGDGLISGAFALTSNGPGSITLNNGLNTFNGLNINAGTVNVNVNGAVGTGPINLNGGTLHLGNVGNTAVTLPAAVAVNVNSDSIITASNKSDGISGAVSGSGNLSIGSSNGGTFTPQGSWANYTGTATFAPVSGTFTLRLNTGFVGSTTGKWIVNSGTTMTYRNGTNGNLTFIFGSLDMAAGSTLSGGQSAGGGKIVYDIGSKGDDNTLASVIQDGATGTSIIKSGTGSLTLSGADTYTGTTTVNAGRLLVNGSIAASAVTVGASGTLGGTGTITPAVANSGIINPGATGAGSTGTLSLGGGVAFADNAGYAVDFNTSSSDLLAVTGNFTLGAGTTLALNSLDGTTSGTYTIATYTGTESGTFATVPSGFTVDYGTGSNSAITVTVGGPAVPEPASLSILALGGIALIRRRRSIR